MHVQSINKKVDQSFLSLLSLIVECYSWAPDSIRDHSDLTIFPVFPNPVRQVEQQTLKIGNKFNNMRFATKIGNLMRNLRIFCSCKLKLCDMGKCRFWFPKYNYSKPTRSKLMIWFLFGNISLFRSEMVLSLLSFTFLWTATTSFL